VAIYNGKTGKKIGEREDWRQRPCASTDGWLFAPAGDEDEQEGYRLEAFHLFKPEPIWIKRNVYAPVAASQGRVFAALMVPVKFPRNAAIPRHVSKFRKGLCCLDLEGQVIWKRTDITLSERYEPPMALAGGRIFVNAQKPKDETGRYRTAIESLDTATGKTLGQAGVGGHPRVAGDVLYLLGDDRFFALSVKDGKTLWHARKLGKYDLGEGVKRGPVIAQGMVFVSNDKRLLSLEPMRLGRDVRKR
jgi:outer membrane protein assembly factor BamB